MLTIFYVVTFVSKHFFDGKWDTIHCQRGNEIPSPKEFKPLLKFHIITLHKITFPSYGSKIGGRRGYANNMKNHLMRMPQVCLTWEEPDKMKIKKDFGKGGISWPNYQLWFERGTNLEASTPPEVVTGSLHRRIPYSRSKATDWRSIAAFEFFS